MNHHPARDRLRAGVHGRPPLPARLEHWMFALLSDPDARYRDLGSHYYDAHQSSATRRRQHVRQLEAVIGRALERAWALGACGAPAPSAEPAKPAAVEPTAVPEAKPAAVEPTAVPEAKPADAGEKVAIAYLNKMGDNPWFVEEVAGAKAVADKLGVEFFNQDLQFDSNLAMTAMDTYIAKGVSGIIIVVPDTKIGPAVIEKAQKAGIPIVAVDDTILDASGQAAPFFGFDAGAAGLKVGELIAEYYKAEGWDKLSGAVIKAVSVEDQDLEVCNLRTEGATSKLTELGVITDADIIHLPYDNTANSGMDAMAPIITANPQVTHWLLYSCNDDGVLGAWRALQNAGVSATNVIGVGINGQLAAEEFKKGEPTGLRASLMAQAKEHGGQAVQAIYDFVTTGKEIPAITFIPAAVMTADNWAELTGQK